MLKALAKASKLLPALDGVQCLWQPRRYHQLAQDGLGRPPESSWPHS